MPQLAPNVICSSDARQIQSQTTIWLHNTTVIHQRGAFFHKEDFCDANVVFLVINSDVMVIECEIKKIKNSSSSITHCAVECFHPLWSTSPPWKRNHSLGLTGHLKWSLHAYFEYLLYRHMAVLLHRCFAAVSVFFFIHFFFLSNGVHAINVTSARMKGLRVNDSVLLLHNDSCDTFS